MRRTYLSLFLLCFILSVTILSALDVTIGNGSQEARKPFDLYYRYSLFETLYYPGEINTAGVIDTIRYYNNFPNWDFPDADIQVWMGITTLPGLSFDWIPSSELTLVYDSTMSFPIGQNTISIPLSVPFSYTGNNLVIMTRSPWMDTWPIAPLNFFCQSTGNSRARNYYSDSIDPDPLNPPSTGAGYSLSGQFPKTTLHFATIIPLHDLAAESVTGNITPLTGYINYYNVAVHNNGAISQTDYLVRLYNSDNQVIASSPGTTIAHGETVQIDVPWIPLTTGETYIYAKVVLDVDQDHSNDQTSNLNILVMPSGVIIDPPIITHLARIPMDMYWLNSLFECIFSSNEWCLFGVQAPMYITNMEFRNDFVTNLLNKPTKIWLGNTNLEDLEAEWIPSTQLTLVYDGNINYPSGNNHIAIPLQTPFLYTGDNLAMMVYRPLDDAYYSSSDNFKCYQSSVNCSRKVASDMTLYDPANPPATSTLNGLYPYTGFFFALTGIGSLNGMVRDNQNQPVSEALIQIDGTLLSTTTNLSGEYNFPYILQGSYQVTASKQGYESQTLPAMITSLNTTELNFNLVPVNYNPDDHEIIVETSLKNIYPNPFITETIINYEIKEPVETTIEIYNTKGQKVRTLTAGFAKSGRYSLVWDGKDYNQRQVSGGVYFLRMTAGTYKFAKKLILIK